MCGSDSRLHILRALTVYFALLYFFLTTVPQPASSLEFIIEEIPHLVSSVIFITTYPCSSVYVPPFNRVPRHSKPRHLDVAEQQHRFCCKQNILPSPIDDLFNSLLVVSVLQAQGTLQSLARTFTTSPNQSLSMYVLPFSLSSSGYSWHRPRSGSPRDNS